jgi:hypothetical protein
LVRATSHLHLCTLFPSPPPTHPGTLSPCHPHPSQARYLQHLGVKLPKMDSLRTDTQKHYSFIVLLDSAVNVIQKCGEEVCPVLLHCVWLLPHGSMSCFVYLSLCALGLRPPPVHQLAEMEGVESLVAAKRIKIRETVLEAFTSKAPGGAPFAVWEKPTDTLRTYVHKLVDAVASLSAAVRALPPPLHAFVVWWGIRLTSPEVVCAWILGTDLQTAALRAHHKTIRGVLNRIASCPFDTTEFKSCLEELQAVVNEMSLGDWTGFSAWVVQLDAKVHPPTFPPCPTVSARARLGLLAV